MSITLIEKSIIPLVVATAILGGFFWQFTTIYPFIIENFTTDRLFVLYTHLIIYTFLVLILIVSFLNLLNHFLLKSKIFIAITVIVILVFYILSYGIFKDLFLYLVKYPISENAIMGLVLFIVTSLGYSLYTLFLLSFNRFIPLIHIFIFTILGITYSALFINSYCYSISDIFNKF